MRVLGIDLHTRHKALARVQLLGLPKVHSIIEESPYREDPSLMMCLIETSMTEDELDQFLWANAQFDYIGTFERCPA